MSKDLECLVLSILLRSINRKEDRIRFHECTAGETFNMNPHYYQETFLKFPVHEL